MGVGPGTDSSPVPQERVTSVRWVHWNPVEGRSQRSNLFTHLPRLYHNNSKRRKWFYPESMIRTVSEFFNLRECLRHKSDRDVPHSTTFDSGVPTSSRSRVCCSSSGPVGS